MDYKAIVIGASAGGMEALKTILSKLPANFSIPILVVQHLKSGVNSNVKKYFQKYCKIEIVEAQSCMKIENSKAYFAPPDYHMLVEKNNTLSLSIEEKVNFSRPSIDVLFETAADAYGSELIGIILTGASSDGSNGLFAIKKRGGLCIVQNPKTAFMEVMPTEAIKKVNVEYILSLDEIANSLINFKNLRQGR